MSNIEADLKPGEVQPWAQKLVEQRDDPKGLHAAAMLPLGPAAQPAPMPLARK